MKTGGGFCLEAWGTQKVDKTCGTVGFPVRVPEGIPSRLPQSGERPRLCSLLQPSLAAAPLDVCKFEVVPE